MMKSISSKDDMAINDHVDELRERMRLLQIDRKANIDVLESNKNVNREEIKKLRDENGSLRTKLAQIQRSATQDDSNQEEKHVAKEVDKMRKVHDDLKLRSARRRRELEDLKDSVKDLELESQRPHMEDNQFTRKIRTLENKLDKAMIKYNEAQSIRKTYEQIVHRLREERVGFDNQLVAIERTLSAKQRDYDELVLLSGDANHAKETALNELDRIRAGYEEEKKRREKELRERNQVVQLRRQMLDRIRQREMLRTQMEENENNAKATTQALNTLNQKMIANERLEARNKIDIFENAFRKIKEATGVSDVNEVIQKIVSQEGTTENLVALTKENQNKIETMNDQKRKLKAKVEEVKYSGVGGGHRRKIVDDHEDQLANSAARLERSRLKYERFNKNLIAMKAGVGHLQDKLDVVRDELGGRKVDLSDDSVVEVLRECELMLMNMVKRIKVSEEMVSRERIFTLDERDDDSPSRYYGDSVSGLEHINDVELASTRPYNQRIPLRYDEYGDHTSNIGNVPGVGNNLNGLFSNDGNNNNDLIDFDEDELTRDKVKRASKQITESIDRKKKKPKKKGERGIGGHTSPDVNA